MKKLFGCLAIFSYAVSIGSLIALVGLPFETIKTNSGEIVSKTPLLVVNAIALMVFGLFSRLFHRAYLSRSQKSLWSGMGKPFLAMVALILGFGVPIVLGIAGIGLLVQGNPLGLFVITVCLGVIKIFKSYLDGWELICFG